jgi:hypothetical protein
MRPIRISPALGRSKPGAALLFTALHGQRPLLDWSRTWTEEVLALVRWAAVLAFPAAAGLAVAAVLEQRGDGVIPLGLQQLVYWSIFWLQRKERAAGSFRSTAAVFPDVWLILPPAALLAWLDWTLIPFCLVLLVPALLVNLAWERKRAWLAEQTDRGGLASSEHRGERSTRCRLISRAILCVCLVLGGLVALWQHCSASVHSVGNLCAVAGYVVLYARGLSSGCVSQPENMI